MVVAAVHHFDVDNRDFATDAARHGDEEERLFNGRLGRV